MPKIQHPLINTDSKHYGNDYEDSSIKIFESQYTISSLLAWATITKEKYIERLGKKTIKSQFIAITNEDNVREEIRRSDIKKIKTYDEYILLLKHVVALCSDDETMAEAMTHEPASAIFEAIDMHFI